MPKLLILRGLPGAGKTTYAKELQKREPGMWKRVCREDLRLMLDNEFYQNDKIKEDLIRSLESSMIVDLLMRRWNVIVDNTNLVEKTVERYRNLVKSLENQFMGSGFFVETIVHKLPTPLKTCLEQNAKRTGELPHLERWGFYE